MRGFDLSWKSSDLGHRVISDIVRAVVRSVLLHDHELLRQGRSDATVNLAKLRQLLNAFRPAAGASETRVESLALLRDRKTVARNGQPLERYLGRLMPSLPRQAVAVGG